MSRDEGMCAMEAAAWLAGEEHSYRSKYVSVVLREPLVKLNDGLDDAWRQKLLPFVPRILGTMDDGKDEARRWLATDWLLRVHTPAWLDAGGMTEIAADIRALPKVCDLASLRAAKNRLKEARKCSDTASAGAGSAIGKVARAGAWYAAREAVRDLSWYTAYAAIPVMPVAHSEEIVAGITAKLVAARVAYLSAVSSAKIVAAKAVAETGDLDVDRHSAFDAAYKQFRPIRRLLRASVFKLLVNMIDPQPNK